MPENGGEFQNAARGRSGILLSLSVVMTAEHQRAPNDGEGDDLSQGTIVLMKLIAAWPGSKRIVCADSYSASATTAMQLLPPPCSRAVRRPRHIMLTPLSYVSARSSNVTASNGA